MRLKISKIPLELFQKNYGNSLKVNHQDLCNNTINPESKFNSPFYSLGGISYKNASLIPEGLECVSAYFLNTPIFSNFDKDTSWWTYKPKKVAASNVRGRSIEKALGLEKIENASEGIDFDTILKTINDQLGKYSIVPAIESYLKQEYSPSGTVKCLVGRFSRINDGSMIIDENDNCELTGGFEVMLPATIVDEGFAFNAKSSVNVSLSMQEGQPVVEQEINPVGRNPATVIYIKCAKGISRPHDILKALSEAYSFDSNATFDNGFKIGGYYLNGNRKNLVEKISYEDAFSSNAVIALETSVGKEEKTAGAIRRIKEFYKELPERGLSRISSLS